MGSLFKAGDIGARYEEYPTAFTITAAVNKMVNNALNSCKKPSKNHEFLFLGLIFSYKIVPLLYRDAHLIKIAVAIIDASHACEASRDVV